MKALKESFSGKKEKKEKRTTDYCGAGYFFEKLPRRAYEISFESLNFHSENSGTATCLYLAA